MKAMKWLIVIAFSSLLAAQQPPTAHQVLKKKDAAAPKHKLGPFDISIHWRTRAEGWNWFQGNTGNSDYGLWNSLLRIGVGQSGDNFDWFAEVEQPSILGLPNNAVVAAPQGQLGLGGTYYAANNNQVNNASAFLKQAFVNFKRVGPAALKIGRFEYFDGLEVKPKDPFLATVIQTRIAHRLISNFGFAAVQRTFDGVTASVTSSSNNFTFFAARPTAGVFQVSGMDELDVDTYYGAYTRSLTTKRSAGELRVFALGYIDHRTLTLKTDTRPQAVRAADHGKIEIATWGADYAHVFNTASSGKFDFLLWGVAQTGSWGNLQQRAGAFVGEAGWQPPVKILKPWVSAGYSYGSGDGNPNDSRHGTFFQLLTTPRQYARFPFYNMMNNEDFYGTLNLRPSSKLALRTEGHALRLASASDLWYLGGGAFQPRTFGFTGRPSNGSRALANVWDAGGDYQITRSFSATLYYGHAWGKSVIAKIYPKQPNGQLIFLETNYHF
ncbi:MAG: alginate export family protein [Terriglobales bacterium]